MTTPVFSLEPLEVVIKENHSPDQFYRTRAGLYVWESFRRIVVTSAKPTEAGTKYQIVPRIMLRGASDKEVEDEMGGKKRLHLFTETEVSAIIAQLIACQAKGEQGPLLNNDYANLFFLDSCIVDVGWGSNYREWLVSTRQRGARRWSKGDQVFSPRN